MIYNVKLGTFGGAMRMGDLVALMNAIQFLRRDNPEVKFYLEPGSVSDADNVQQFLQYAYFRWDYFSEIPSTLNLPWNRVNLWDFRDISGDLLKLNNERGMKNKIAIFPVWDAPYNTYRNWPNSVLNMLFIQYNQPVYDSFEKVICISPNMRKVLDNEYAIPPDFQVSTNFIDNLDHVLSCYTYIGGDTGFSHLASVLDRGPIDLIYFYSSRGLIHTTPFHLFNGKGHMNRYWLDFEGTSWGSHNAK